MICGTVTYLDIALAESERHQRLVVLDLKVFDRDAGSTADARLLHGRHEHLHEAGVQAHLTGAEVDKELLPTLYLPVGKSVDLELNSRDVIHSFWVPAFLQKRDMIPGKTNYIRFTPTKEGTFDGKCAELCGEYHSEMLFRVKVVSESEFKAHMDKLRQDGNTGLLGAEYDRNPNLNEK